MFQQNVMKVLNSTTQSLGWAGTAQRLNLTEQELRQRLTSPCLSLEDALAVVQASSSPELLRYVLDRIAPTKTPSNLTKIH